MDCILSESALKLDRGLLTGIRDCECRFGVVVNCGGESGSSPVAMGMMGTGLRAYFLEFMPVMSLRERRCMSSGRGGIGLLKSMPSKEGAAAIYHVVGDGGSVVACEVLSSSRNIAFGRCMLPMEPDLGLAGGIPYPVANASKVSGTISPKSGLRTGALVLGLRLVME